jgi:hypothetical protein
MQKLFILALAAIFALTACTKDAIRGNGTISTREIPAAAFTAVESHYDIKAIIRYGATRNVKATGYDNLLDILDFSVENNTLKLKFNQQYNQVRGSNVVAEITVPVLERVAIHGSNDIEVRDIQAGTAFSARIHGSGNIRVFNSRYDTTSLHVHGSGDIDAQGLQVKVAEANIHGHGDILVRATEKMKAGIYGNGNIHVWGNPQLQTEIRGNGRVYLRQ